MTAQRCISSRWRLGCLLLLAGLTADVRAQVGPTGPAPSPDAVSLPTDRQALKKLRTAQDHIDKQTWTEAVRFVQLVLDDKEDQFLPIEKEDLESGKPVRWKSARTEADRLLNGLPTAGRFVYQQTYGGQAKALFDDALKVQDMAKLEEVTRRYFHTTSGFEAMRLLAVHHLDRGRHHAAALAFERLLNHPEAGTLSTHTLVQAAAALQHSGRREQAAAAWKTLTQRATPEGLKVGTQLIALDMLRKEVESLPMSGPRSSDWTVFRGDTGRSGVGSGGTPFLDPLWQTSVTQLAETRSRIGQALVHLENNNQPVLPAFFPLAVGGRLYYRSFGALHAVDVHTGKPLWKQPAELKLGLETLLADAGTNLQLTHARLGWWPRYTNDWHVLFENATVGTLSTDGRQVYAVEDLPLPPHPMLIYEMQNGVQRSFGPLKDAVYHSRLKAFDAQTGALAWEIGGKSTGIKGEVVPPLFDTYFLGPPLPLGGRLYVLNEKNNDIRLVCLDPVKGDLLWFQSLAAPNDKFLNDVGRRIRGAQPTYADGLLLCPTNGGALVAVEPMRRALVWAHVYRDKNLAPGMDFGFPMQQAGWLLNAWRPSAPVVQNGKVVFAAADGDVLHCLNVKDGTVVWKSHRVDDDRCFAGVFDGKVLLLGRKNCRALKLDDGRELWHTPTGLPSGQGVAVGSQYYLPLKRGAIAVLNLDTGKDPTIIACRNQEMPGNLLFHEGDLVSQSVQRIAVYPQLEARLARLEEVLRITPDDPERRYERAQHRLDQGDVVGALADLRVTLANQPAAALKARAEERLFESLTRLLQRDFSGAEKHLEEYRTLCNRPILADATPERRAALLRDNQRRQLQLRALIANGRQEQGRPLDALLAYQELFALVRDENRLLPLDSSPVESRPSVWVAARVRELFAAATPEQLVALDEKVGTEWKALQTTSDPAAWTAFIALFGHTAAGKEARLQRLERLLDDPSTAAAHDAEQQVRLLAAQLDDPPLAARALDVQARLLTRHGRLEDAVAVYRRLQREHAATTLREGRTGADVVLDAMLDKRLLSFWGASRSVWDGARLSVTETRQNIPMRQNELWFEPEGEVAPSLRRLAFVLDLTTSTLRLVDQGTGAVQWTTPLSLGGQKAILAMLTQWNTRLNCQVKGHVAILNFGHLLCAVDLFEQRMLWQRSLPGASGTAQPNWSPDGYMCITYSDGWNQKLGTSGPAQSPYLFFQTRDGLIAVDPVRGETLWNRTDVQTPVEMFGDGECLYLVDSRMDGTYGGTRVLRAEDGATVSAPPFSEIYQKQWSSAMGPWGRFTRPEGRYLLSRDVGADDRLSIRVHDVRTGKEIWKQDYPAKTIQAYCSTPGLAAVVEPDGKATIYEIVSGKVLLQAQIDKEHLDKVDSIQLLRDRGCYYFALKGPQDDGPNGESWPFVTGNIAAVPVNGMLYAFERESGKLRWRHQLHHQQIFTEQLEDMPVLLCAAGVNQPLAPGAGMQVVYFTTQVLDKRTGKILWSKQLDGNNGYSQGYHAIQADERVGTVDLLSSTHRVRIAPVK